MNKIKQIVLSLAVLFLSACGSVKIYEVKNIEGDSARLEIVASTLESALNIPFIAETSIEMNFFSSKDSCPDFAEYTNGYLSSIKFKKNSHVKSINLPAGHEVFVLIEQKAGNATFSSGFKFNLDPNNEYAFILAKSTDRSRLYDISFSKVLDSSENIPVALRGVKLKSKSLLGEKIIDSEECS